MDLLELARPFPEKYLTKSGKGMTAVDHTVVTQRLLEVCGPYDLDVVQLITGTYPDVVGKNQTWPGGTGIVGAVVRLSVSIDGERVSVTEVGGVENAAMITDGDGERAKHAVSDGVKRCAMRLGLGLHVWAQQHYYLDRSLAKRNGGESTDAA